jgi:hypothetical protein
MGKRQRQPTDGQPRREPNDGQPRHEDFTATSPFVMTSCPHPLGYEPLGGMGDQCFPQRDLEPSQLCRNMWRGGSCSRNNCVYSHDAMAVYACQRMSQRLP